jgi:hypothetical protein
VDGIIGLLMDAIMACNPLAVVPGMLDDTARLITSAHNTIKKEKMHLRSFGRRYNPVLIGDSTEPYFLFQKKDLDEN